MTPERARRILESYGAEPARWPAAERAALAALLAAEPALAGAARGEAALDRLLAGAEPQPAPVPAGLAQRIRGRARAAVQRRPLHEMLFGLLPKGWRWAPAAAMGCAAMVGFLLGLGLAQPVPPADAGTPLFGAEEGGERWL